MNESSNQGMRADKNYICIYLLINIDIIIRCHAKLFFMQFGFLSLQHCSTQSSRPKSPVAILNRKICIMIMNFLQAEIDKGIF